MDAPAPIFPVYCDGIETISLSGGMIRMDLFVYAGAAPAKDQPPARRPSGQLVMPPQGFLQSLHAMTQLAKQLESQGLLRRDAKPAP